MSTFNILDRISPLSLSIMAARYSHGPSLLHFPRSTSQLSPSTSQWSEDSSPQELLKQRTLEKGMLDDLVQDCMDCLQHSQSRCQLLAAEVETQRTRKSKSKWLPWGLVQRRKYMKCKRKYQAQIDHDFVWMKDVLDLCLGYSDERDKCEEEMKNLIDQIEGSTIQDQEQRINKWKQVCQEEIMCSSEFECKPDPNCAACHPCHNDQCFNLECFANGCDVSLSSRRGSENTAVEDEGDEEVDEQDDKGKRQVEDKHEDADVESNDEETTQEDFEFSDLDRDRLPSLQTDCDSDDQSQTCCSRASFDSVIHSPSKDITTSLIASIDWPLPPPQPTSLLSRCSLKRSNAVKKGYFFLGGKWTDDDEDALDNFIFGSAAC